MAKLNVDLSKTTENVAIEILKPGWYEAQIENSEIKQGMKGDYIEWVFDVTNYTNKVWNIMSLGSEFGCEMLKSLAVAINYPDPNHINDTEDFHFIPLQIKVGISKDKNGVYDDKNIIKGFKKINKSQNLIGDNNKNNNNNNNPNPDPDPDFWK